MLKQTIEAANYQLDDSNVLHERIRRNVQRIIDARLLHNHEFAIGSEPYKSWMQTLIDSSHIIPFCVSISVIIYGSFKSLNIDSDNEQILHQNDSDEKLLDEPENQQEQHTQNIDTTHALLIPVAASISLLLMFFFFESIQTIFLFCTSILAIVTFAFLLLPVCLMIFKYFYTNPETYTKKYSCCLFGKFTLPELLAQFFSSCLVGLWIITGHWILMDIIGVGFCVTFIAIVRLPSLKVSTLLLVGLVIYDVFWVYFSHLIFDSNVMVKVATKEADNPFRMVARKFNIESSFSNDSPKLSLPGKLVVPSYQNKGNFSILGLGDIVVPGLLLCFVLRFDAYKRSQLMNSIKFANGSTKANESGNTYEIMEKNETNHQQPHKLTCCCFDCTDINNQFYSSSHKNENQLKYRSKSFPYISFPFNKYSNPPESDHPTHLYTFKNFLRLNTISYFHCALAGYFLGLLTATLSSEVFREAQPALLFLVPFTLIPLSIMAYIKGDLNMMWNEPFTYSAPKYFYV